MNTTATTDWKAIWDDAVARGADSGQANHHMQTLRLFGPDVLRRFADTKSNQQRTIRALLAAYDAR